MSWIKKSELALIILSSFIGLVLIELGFSFFNKNPTEIYKWDRRYMLFKQNDQGPVFKNVNNIFVYQPNQKIESTTFYYVDKEWVKEYDYITPTNNLGLVQTKPTLPNRDSLLILGDSFTEGQGAYPWFEKFRESLKTNLQPINGGILGTGFQSWKLLHDYLIANDIQVKRLVVIFISSDYERGVWNMPENTLACIKNSKSCVGYENFYGKPTTEELSNFLDKLRAYREKSFTPDGHSFKGFLKKLLPGTVSIFSFIKSRTNIMKNGTVIQELVASYGSNVLFIHIPEKSEVALGKASMIGEEAVKKIYAVNGMLFDGRTKCGFDQNDFFVNDGHPNARGYEKIAECVKAALRSHWGY